MSPSLPAWSWDVLVPVKAPTDAKTRLAELGDDQRRRISTAFAVDVLGVALRCPPVRRVAAVGTTTSHLPFTWNNAFLAIPEDPGAHTAAVRSRCGSLNGALVLGASVLRAGPKSPLAVVVADLPALRSTTLAAVLTAFEAQCRREPACTRGFIADLDDDGTTILLHSPDDEPHPEMGPASSNRHRDAGYVELSQAVDPSARRDVDNPAHLIDAVRLGVGPATARALAGRPLRPTQPMPD